MQEKDETPPDTAELKQKPKGLFFAPNRTDYFLDPRGQLRRVDLRGAGTRSEQREAKRRKRNARCRELKALRKK